jgi:hypothetical protein
MTRAGSDARFAIKLDGTVGTPRGIGETAIDAARFLQVLNPSAKVEMTDLCDGSQISFEFDPKSRTRRSSPTLASKQKRRQRT